MIRAITITLLERAQTGVDELNRPVYAETPAPVSGVLVGEPSTEDIVSELEMTGRRLAYTLALPKGDTHVWENRRVILPEPFAGTYRVIGVPTAGIEANIPLKWNKKVKLERYGGEADE